MLLIFFYLIIIIIMIILKNSLYTKPYSYYVLITIATIVIGFQIVTKDWCEGKNVWMVLFLQILPLAAIIRGSSLLINPYLIGPDVPLALSFHSKVNQYWIFGHICFPLLLLSFLSSFTVCKLFNFRVYKK